MASKDARQKAAYEFLQTHLLSRDSFTFEDLGKAATWEDSTVETHYEKQFCEYLTDLGDGSYRVQSRFKRVSLERFKEQASQVRRIRTNYTRAAYRGVVVYEFFLPLTREAELRRALDELFYRDTLEDRLREIGVDGLSLLLNRSFPQSEDELVAEAIREIGDRIGGFSVSHVNGRFRLGGLISRKAAGERMELDQPYLIDETTAVVRFIMPCTTTRSVHGRQFDATKGEETPADRLNAEIQLIRGLFLEVFVEAVVPAVRGEALIWLLETSPNGLVLYELERDVEPRQKRSRVKRPPGVVAGASVDVVDLASDRPPRDASSAEDDSQVGAHKGRRSDATLTRDEVDGRPIASKRKGHEGGASSRQRAGASEKVPVQFSREVLQARPWLRANGYEAVADLIDAVIAEWSAAGIGARKDWWQILAGGANGRALNVSGHAFPVLAVAQVRQGKPVTQNAGPAPAGQVAPAALQDRSRKT